LRLTIEINRSITLRKEAYKLTIHIQTTTPTPESSWWGKETIAVFLAITPLSEDHKGWNEKTGDEASPVIFGCGRACVRRFGPVSINWGVDISSTGSLIRLGSRLKNRLLRTLYQEKEGGDPELTPLLV
jgi:hypothetical protein